MSRGFCTLASEFKGDPFICCQRDLACNEESKYCYETDRQKRACPPEYRNMSGHGCRDLMYNYCTGEDISSGNIDELTNRWISNVQIKNSDGQVLIYDKPCYKVLYRNLYDIPEGCAKIPLQGSTSFINTEGYNYSQKLMNGMISKYLKEGGNLVASEFEESNIRMNDMILNICKTTPGLCQKSLFSYCSKITIQDIERDIKFLPWCGCYMSPEQYSKYTELYGINRECTPTCNMEGVIPLAFQNNGEPKRCSQTTCVIDNINIDIINSVGGDINFKQLCSSCGDGNVCNCTITNGNFTSIDAKIGNISISQECSGTSKCFKDDKQIPCNGDVFDKYEKIENESKKNYNKAVLINNITVILIFLFLFLIIVILWFIFHP